MEEVSSASGEVTSSLAYFQCHCERREAISEALGGEHATVRFLRTSVPRNDRCSEREVT